MDTCKDEVSSFWGILIKQKRLFFEPAFVCRIRQCFPILILCSKQKSKLGYRCKGKVGCQFYSIFGLLFGWAFAGVLAEQ